MPEPQHCKEHGGRNPGSFFHGLRGSTGAFRIGYRRAGDLVAGGLIPAGVGYHSRPPHAS